MASPEAIADGIKTNRQARQVMGLVAEMLRRGYEEVPIIDSGFVGSAVDFFSGSTTELRAHANSLLDVVNAYAQGIFAFIPDNDEPLNEDFRGRIALSIQQAQDAVKSINEVSAKLAVDFTDEMAAAVLPLVNRIVDKVAELPKKLSQGILASIWPLLLVAGIVLVIMWRVRKASPI
jgi:hypothetical protein